MPKKNKGEVKKYYPFVSICTPTFNRRPFYEMTIQCFNNQTYPKNRMEWIIIDDGTDKIGDLVKNIPQVQYFSYDERMKLGKKRNLMHEKCKGDIIIYMDDDDYYPPDRVSHAVETLQKHPNCMIAGSSEMYIYFKHIQKMYKFGPYGPNHATAATFAFRKELLKETKYSDESALAEEQQFLKNYKIPMVQLDSMKSILVFSHDHNSFDKKVLLNQGDNKFVTLSEKTVDDFVKQTTIKQFFLEKIDALLSNYDAGKPEHKPEVIQQMKEMTEKREHDFKVHQSLKMQFEEKLGIQNNIIKTLMKENKELKEKNEYMNKKITELIQIQMQHIKDTLVE